MTGGVNKLIEQSSVRGRRASFPTRMPKCMFWKVKSSLLAIYPKLERAWKEYLLSLAYAQAQIGTRRTVAAHASTRYSSYSKCLSR